MKKLLLLATSALLLLSGCAKEEQGLSTLLDGEATTVTFTASMDDGTATKAAADGDGAAASVNRCIMEVYYGDELFTRMYSTVTDKKASFTTQLVANRTYTVAFWADHVESTSALETDLYYTTTSLKTIALKEDTYAGNNDARDAFFHFGEYKIAQGGSSFGGTGSEIYLKRPFAQVNVITTDWDKADKVSNLKPTNVDVTIKNPMTAFNALNGAASTTVSTLTYNAAVYTSPNPVSPASETDKTLSMDYLFAAADKAVIDIDWKAGQGDAASTVSHSFSTIPYQRNYRTNIKGNLLTATGQWNVTVDPIWESGSTGADDIVYNVVKDIVDANTVIASEIASGKKEISVKFTSQPNDAGTPGTTSEGITCNSILTTNLPEDGTLNILIEAETKDLYIGDYESATSTTVKTSDVNAAVVNVNVPQGSSIRKLVINAPSKTVYINGIEVNNAGTITNLDAITSDNTLIISKDQTVTNLTVHQGALEIHGTVVTASVEETVGEHVYVRDCEGLSQTVYDVLEPYIDVDNGYVGEQESGQETYRIYQKAESEKVAKIGDVTYYTLNAALNAATADQTIEIIKDFYLTDLCSGAQEGSLVLINKSITLDLGTHTINCTKEPVDDSNDATAIVVISDQAITATIKNGTINTSNACNGIIISDKATLNVEDLNVYQNGTKDGVKAYRNSALTVRNGGTLNVKSGNYTAEQYALYSKANGGVITVDGGTFTTKGQDAEITSSEVRFPAAFRSDFATVTGNKTTINGGTFTVVSGKNGASIDFGGAQDNTLIITDGTFTDFVQSQYNKAQIKGGTFQSTIYKFDGGHIGYYLLSGGTFVDNVGDASHKNTSIEEGYEVVKDGDVWKVVVMKTAKIGTTIYGTLAAAFAAAQDGETMELLRDCSFSSTISIDKEITLDMKSKDINVKAYGTGFSIEDGGNLTVSGGSFSQGAPWSDGCGDDYNYFLFETKSGSALTLDEVTTSGYSTHDGAIVRMRGGATVDLNNANITSDSYIINTEGSTVQNNLSVVGGTFTCSESSGDAFYFEYTTGDFNSDGTTTTTLNYPFGVEAEEGANIDLTNVVATQCTSNCVYYGENSIGVLTNCEFTSTTHTVTTAGDINRSIGGSKWTGHITVNGGTYICHGSNKSVLKIWNSGGEITVNSGTFTNDNGGDVAYADSRNASELGTDTQPAWIIVNGGTLTGTVGTQHLGKVYFHGGKLLGTARLNGNGSPIEADGGMFSFNPATTIISGTTKAVKITDGYKSVDNGDNTWTIKPTTPTTGTAPDLGDWR